MSNAYTDTGASSLGGSVGGAGLVQKAYDRLLEFALRSEPLIRSVAARRCVLRSPRPSLAGSGVPRRMRPSEVWTVPASDPAGCDV